MKTSIKLLLAAVLLAPAMLQAGVGAWTASGPTFNGVKVGAAALAIDPSTPTSVYASGYRVWKSSDGGATWLSSDTGISNSTVESIVIDPSNARTLYAGSYGVFKSTDGGANWSEVSNGFGYYKNFVASLAVDPAVPTTVYAGLGGGAGLWKSSDGGANWVKSDNGMVPATIKALAIDPKAHLTVYAATELNGLWKSKDGGASWVAAGLASEGVYALAIDPANSSTLYAAGQPSLRASDGTYGVFKSSDGGASWTAVNNGLPTTGGKPSVDGRGIAIDSSNGTIYLATYGTGVYRSSDGGASWAAFNTGMPDDSGARSMRAVAAAKGMVYAGSTDIFSYSASGQSGFAITGNSSGDNAALYLTAQIHVAASDAGQNGNTYLAILFPGNIWFLHNGVTWVRWLGGSLPVYSFGRLADVSIPILNGVNVNGLAGTYIVAGYGLSETDMLANGKIAVIYTIR